jgi:hypothetical protein
MRVEKSRQMLIRICLATTLGWFAFLPLRSDADDRMASDARHGEAIYRAGILDDGRQLTGLRSDGIRVSGASAACVNCHRASGMGGAEGNMLVPPVVGSILMSPGRRPLGGYARSSPSVSRLANPAFTRVGYTADTFARVMVEGRRQTGEFMAYLMPRYELDERSLNQLMAYLNTLKVGDARGVDRDALHLATIVTADAPAAEQEATVAIISKCLAERSPRRVAEDTPVRPWQHHIWRLGTNPAAWPQEMAQYQREQPVFAVVSGISGGAWLPIHRFCEREGLPCVLPNTASIDSREASHWSFYFSQGVSLEASAMANLLVEQPPDGGWRRIVQLVTDSEASRLAAASLRTRLHELHIQAEIKELRYDHADIQTLISALTTQDALVLWLEPAALRYLTTTAAPPHGTQLAISGELSGLDEAPVHRSWREHALMLYPYEQAARRSGRIVLNAGNWMASQGLAIDPTLNRLQGNTYSTCEVATRALRMMRERYSRQYFMELLEASDEAGVATAYPRFTLGPDQRVGSRGAYIMRYKGPEYSYLTPVGGWTIPD